MIDYAPLTKSRLIISTPVVLIFWLFSVTRNKIYETLRRLIYVSISDHIVIPRRDSTLVKILPICSRDP